jgi:hypothetical protein
MSSYEEKMKDLIKLVDNMTKSKRDIFHTLYGRKYMYDVNTSVNPKNIDFVIKRCKA